MVRELDHIRIKEKVAHGAFGEIRKCIDTNTGQELAVKIEKSSGKCQLKHEYNVYKSIGNLDGPMVYDIGSIVYDDKYRMCMTMELLGSSMEQLFLKLNKNFSTKTIFMFAVRAIKQIERTHKKSFVHRDIKPDNFMTDPSKRKVYLIDYGLAKEYKDKNTSTHRKLVTGKNLTGTARYCSLNTHLGLEQSRRDDMESLGFCIVYFFKSGRLPWQGIKAETKVEKYEAIKNRKQSTPLNELCKDLPNEVYRYFVHVRTLEYEDRPSYDYLSSIFSDGLTIRGYKDDGKWDWLKNK